MKNCIPSLIITLFTLFASESFAQTPCPVTTKIPQIKGSLSPCVASRVNYCLDNTDPDLATYRWTSNGIFIGSGLSTYITWINTGPQVLTVTPYDKCMNPGTPVQVTVTPVSSSSIIAPTNITSSTGSSIFCVGSTVQFAVPAVEGLTPVWKMCCSGDIAPTLTASGNSVSVTLNKEGYFSIQASYSNGTCSGPETSLPIGVIGSIPSLSDINGDDKACLNTSTKFLVSAANTMNYNWTLSGGGVITSLPSSIASVDWKTQGGPYQLTVTASNTCSNVTATKTFSVSVGPTKPATVSSITTSRSYFCNGTPETFTATAIAGATGYLWEFQSSQGISTTTTTTNTLTKTFSLEGDYILNVYTSNGYCISTPKEYRFRVLGNPVISVDQNSSACLNVNTTLSATDLPFHSYTWNIGDGTIIGATNTSTISVRWNTEGKKLISVVATSPCGLSSTPMTPIEINVVNPIQPLSVLGATTVCTGAYMYVVSPLSADILSPLAWEVIPASAGTITLPIGPPPPAPKSINSSINATWKTLGNCTLRVTASNACGSIQNDIPIIVKSGTRPVNVSITRTDPICLGSAASVSASPIESGVTYSWTAPSAALTANGANATVEWPSTRSSQVVYAIPANASCQGNIASLLVSSQTSGGTTSTSTTQVCTSNNVSLSLSDHVGNVIGWEVRQGANASSMGSWQSVSNTSSFASITYMVVNTTQSNYYYDFRARVRNGSCDEAFSTETRITVLPKPNVIVASNLQICSGQNTNIILGSNTPGCTFQWGLYNITGSSITGGASGIGTTINNTLTNTGTTNGIITYLVKIYTTPTGSCPKDATYSLLVPVTVFPRTSITNTSTQLQYSSCGSASINFTPTSNLLGTTYTWTSSVSGSVTGASSTGSGSIVNTLVNTGTSTATVTYTITPWANGCSGNAVNYVVTLKPKPIATATTQSICTGSLASINLSSSVSNTTFSWPAPVMVNVIGGSGGTGSTISQALSLSSSTSTGTATYSITPVANGCTGTSISTVVSVKPIAVLTAPSSDTICSGTTLNYAPTSNIPSTIYSWTSTVSGSVTGASASGTGLITNTLVNTGATNATVTYAITPITNGCSGTISNYVVTVKPKLIASISGLTSFCTSTTLTANPSGDSYLWSNGKTTKTITVTSSDTYSVTISNSTSCSGTASLSVNKKSASAYISANGADICDGITLTASYGTSYRWSTGSTSNYITTYSYGTYSVSVTLTNGCVATAYYTIPSSDVLSVNSSGRAAPPPCDEINILSLESEFNSVSVSPNPISSIVFIEISNPVNFDVPINFVNQFGQQVYTTVLESGEKAKYINSENLLNGLYIIKVGAIGTKVVVNH